MTRKAVVYLTSSVMFFAFLTHPLISEGQVEIHLSQGWNLVSLPVEPENDAIPYIPASISTWTIIPHHLKKTWTNLIKTKHISSIAVPDFGAETL